MNTPTSEASTRRRVKLYILNEERSWDDKGTGHVSAMMNDNTSMSLVVISESDGSVLLESRIQTDTAYQKQQETLIVWSEGETSDLALSFQEKTGCDDIWEKICNVQGKDPSVEITQELSDESDETDEDIDADNSLPGFLPYSGILGTNGNSGISGGLIPLDLPNLELSNLSEIVDIFNTHATLRNQRELLALSILDKSTFLKQLCDVFHKANDLDDIESLHHIHDIAKQMLLLNHPQLYMELFSPNMLHDLIGMLEHTPHGHKPHRAFLQEKAQFRDVLDIATSSSPPVPELNELTQKIHQTYRIQYIQDCCLSPPSMLDENSTHNLQSMLQQNKSYILRQVLNNDTIMRRLLSELSDDNTALDDRRRCELTLFLRELCQMCASLSGPEKDTYIQRLIVNMAGPNNLLSTTGSAAGCSKASNTSKGGGLLGVLKRLFVSTDDQVVYAALDMLHILVDTHCTLVRDYLFREGQYVRDDEDLFFNILIDQMLRDKDPEGSHAMNISIIVRNLIDPDSILGNGFTQLSEKTEFVSFLLRRVMSHLFTALRSNTEKNSLVKDDYRTAVVLNHVLEIFSYCMDAHSHAMKNFVTQRQLFIHVATLLQSKHTFLVLGVVRFLRKVLNLKDEFYNRTFIRFNLFQPLVDVFRRNGRRYNLLNSAMVEMFDFILSEPVLCLVQELGRQGFLELLCKEADYVDIFENMRSRYEGMMKRNSAGSAAASLVSPPNAFISATSSLSHGALPIDSFGRSSSANGGTGFHNSLSSSCGQLNSFHGCLSTGNSVVSSLGGGGTQRFRRDPRSLDEEEEQWFNQDDDDNEEEEEEELALGQTQSSLSLGGGMSVTGPTFSHHPLPSLQLPSLSSTSSSTLTTATSLNCAPNVTADSSSSDDEQSTDAESEKKSSSGNVTPPLGSSTVIGNIRCLSASALGNIGDASPVISVGSKIRLSTGGITIQLKSQRDMSVVGEVDRKRKSVSGISEVADVDAPNKKKPRAGGDPFGESEREEQQQSHEGGGELGVMFSPPHGNEESTGRSILEDIDDSTTSGSSSTAEMESQLSSGLVDYSDEDSDEEEESRGSSCSSSLTPTITTTTAVSSSESTTVPQENPEATEEENNHSILANSISLTGPLQLPVVTTPTAAASDVATLPSLPSKEEEPHCEEEEATAPFQDKNTDTQLSPCLDSSCSSSSTSV